MKILLFYLAIPLMAFAGQPPSPPSHDVQAVTRDQPSMEGRKPGAHAVDPEAELKNWFADVLWQKFIVERDPRLDQTPVSQEELSEFIENAQRSGTSVSLSMEDLTRLVKFREGGCEAEPAVWGLDLQRGFQWD